MTQDSSKSEGAAAPTPAFARMAVRKLLDAFTSYQAATIPVLVNPIK